MDDQRDYAEENYNRRIIDSGDGEITAATAGKRFQSDNVSYLRDGTYARESDGAGHLWHSPFKFNNGAAALGNMRHEDNWRIVRDGLELQSVYNLLGGNILRGEFVEV